MDAVYIGENYGINKIIYKLLHEYLKYQNSNLFYKKKKTSFYIKLIITFNNCSAVGRLSGSFCKHLLTKS